MTRTPAASRLFAAFASLAVSGLFLATAILPATPAMMPLAA